MHIGRMVLNIDRMLAMRIMLTTLQRMVVILLLVIRKKKLLAKKLNVENNTWSYEGGVLALRAANSIHNTQPMASCIGDNIDILIPEQERRPPMHGLQVGSCAALWCPTQNPFFLFQKDILIVKNS